MSNFKMPVYLNWLFKFSEEIHEYVQPSHTEQQGWPGFEHTTLEVRSYSVNHGAVVHPLESYQDVSPTCWRQFQTFSVCVYFCLCFLSVLVLARQCLITREQGRWSQMEINVTKEMRNIHRTSQPMAEWLLNLQMDCIIQEQKKVRRMFSYNQRKEHRCETVARQCFLYFGYLMIECQTSIISIWLVIPAQGNNTGALGEPSDPQEQDPLS